MGGVWARDPLGLGTVWGWFEQLKTAGARSATCIKFTPCFCRKSSLKTTHFLRCFLTKIGCIFLIKNVLRKWVKTTLKTTRPEAQFEGFQGGINCLPTQSLEPPNLD